MNKSRKCKCYLVKGIKGIALDNNVLGQITSAAM
jgi:hypothetical protein